MLLKVPGYAQKLFVWQRVIIKTTITEREFEYKQINLEGLFTLSIARIQGADKNNPALISRHA
ncbi:TPA: hypothetical protein JBE46_06180 [Legionella pneumophila subsp. pneumophila]|uniref:Uncharacterized protein n=1 Tax=Legionella pneumophila TaxID=446 RepID=A0A378KHV2_LEGPN|nr:hypothetical protein [Legionella pneumophila subsp. pneumophila]RYX12771.1 hypothetical protein D7214_01250 [Legionella pneumophila]TIE29426.1 hypothetical protein DIZ48_04160 [Legionella pneumophila]TIE50931.1 hypothetical protein DIZ50_04160 [Legionella pneumophila]TIG83842.1 hypothetical protein DI110_11105 [Legionella pneumophila]